jgi:Mg-chelatase subunit ChlD
VVEPLSPPPSFEDRKCEEVVPKRKPWEAPQVYFVVDASGSMAEDAGGSTRLDAAKSSIKYMAEHLPGDVITGLINFTDCSAIVNAGTMSRDKLIRATNALSPEGGTDLARSIERAGNTMSRTRKGIMIVATDGEDSCRGDPCAAAREAVAKNPNLTINVVDVGSSGVGQCIANAGNGRVFAADSAAEITHAMVKASRQEMVPKKCVETP